MHLYYLMDLSNTAVVCYIKKANPSVSPCGPDMIYWAGLGQTEIDPLCSAHGNGSSPHAAHSKEWSLGLLCIWSAGLAQGMHYPWCAGWTQLCRQHRGSVWSPTCSPCPRPLVQHVLLSPAHMLWAAHTLCMPHMPCAQRALEPGCAARKLD